MQESRNEHLRRTLAASGRKIRFFEYGAGRLVITLILFVLVGVMTYILLQFLATDIINSGLEDPWIKFFLGLLLFGGMAILGLEAYACFVVSDQIAKDFSFNTRRDFIRTYRLLMRRGATIARDERELYDKIVNSLPHGERIRLQIINL